MNNRRLDDSVVSVPRSGRHPKWGEIGDAGGRLSEKMEVSFHFSLTPQQDALMASRLESGQTMTLAEIVRDFGPDPGQVKRLTDWLDDNDYTEVRFSADGRTVYATNTAARLLGTLGCEMVTVGGQLGAATSPTVPVDLADLHSVNGLQPFVRRRKNLHRSDRILRNAGAMKAEVNLAALPYRVASMRAAYSVPAIYNGTGQTVGILIDSFPSDSDMTAFWASNGVAGSLSRITKINVRNVRIPAPSGEESLDVQWVTGMAPNANVRIYASGDLRFTSLDVCLDRMIFDASTNPSFRVVSVSLGLGELEMPTAELVVENAKYSSLRLLGVNVFVSSGDGGSNPDGLLQAEFPSSSPNVVSVGGTSLRLSTTGGLVSETAWSGSGGGVSAVYAKPAWQSAISGTKRMLPDISAVADPSTGAYVVLAGRVWQFGGTSLSAPVWAGICALINDARVRAGKSRIGFLPPLLYPIYSGKVRDIVFGSNGAYRASAGYDRVTGLGTPLVGNLVTALVALP